MTRLKVTIAATLALLYLMGMIWWCSETRFTVEPGIAKEYKSFRVRGGH
jgi:hypothetical protein